MAISRIVGGTNQTLGNAIKWNRRFTIDARMTRRTLGQFIHRRETLSLADNAIRRPFTA